ncbi:probable acyl-CoA dehydrogenase 6 [Ptychodera flava]|uniref:probable acyl-CoA dehydrogenase 6 n=1 Tax=Ptychodera flava TaxID=63121 RepID=UPI00396A7B9A
MALGILTRAARRTILPSKVSSIVGRLPRGCLSSYTSSSLEGELPGDITEEGIFNESHVELRRAVNKFIEREISPFVDKWEAAKRFPAHDLFKKMGDAGFLGINRPKEYGGMGLDFSYTMAFTEELGGIRCGGLPLSIGMQADVATPGLTSFGSHELKKLFLEPTIKGEMVACLGVSETGSGSDVASIKTTAVKKGGDYIINGGKMWITNGIQADWMCLLANTGDGPPHLNKSMICVPLDTKGVTKSREIKKLGMNSSDTAEIYFEDVRIPQSYLIGQEGMGFTYQMLQFQVERILMACVVLLPIQDMISETINYTKQRKAFGKSILDNQSVHFRLAELETELELLRSLIYRATAMYLQGKDITRLASMAKLKSGRLVRETADACLQYWGGMGFTDDVLISRYYRDFRLMSIGGGADEVMLTIISKYMGSLPTPTKKKKK